MKRSLLALTLLAALPFAASAADGLSYNYVQGGYTHVNSDINANGWAIDGSAAIAPNFHVFGGYNTVKADTIVLGASAGAPSQFCSTSSRRPGRLIHWAKYPLFPGVCTPITSATEYW